MEHKITIEIIIKTDFLKPKEETPNVHAFKLDLDSINSLFPKLTEDFIKNLAKEFPKEDSKNESKSKPKKEKENEKQMV